jgi:quercetin dioxygenase-like cupin family protein
MSRGEQRLAIRLIRLYTGDDGQSHFYVSEIAWNEATGLNEMSRSGPAHAISFEETAAGASLGWHNAPRRQYVITLSGRLEFETRSGKKQTVQPGDVLLAEDTTGGGHRWRLIDHQPWRRVYIAVPLRGQQSDLCFG